MNTQTEIDRDELQQMIDGTVAAYRHDPKELRKVLKAILWRIVDAQGRAIQTDARCVSRLLLHVLSKAESAIMKGQPL